MKDQVSDANFPKTGEGRVYHLGLKAGELANRIITVGDPARARIIAQYLDSSETSADEANEPEENEVELGPNKSKRQPQRENLLVSEVHSERGFLTLTGTYKSVPISIVSIGMGAPNMDFFVREGREILDEDGQEEMIIIRFGSCGGLASLPVGSLTVPKAAINVSRNYDYDFINTEEKEGGEDDFLKAYRISKPATADPQLQQLLLQTLKQHLPTSVIMDGEHVNASADSFYSSQGRYTSFPDHNKGLIDHLVAIGVSSLEMETFHLLHLANNWPRPPKPVPDPSSPITEATIQPPPPTSPPLTPHVVPSTSLPGEEAEETILYPSNHVRQNQASNTSSNRTIRAAAVQMIFAERATRAFISPEEVDVLQEATSKGLLETLASWNVQTVE